MFGISPTVIAVEAVILLVLTGLAGGVGFKTGSAFKQGQWDAAAVAQKQGEDAALKAAAEAIAKIEVKSETHIQPLRVEVRTNTVYRDCKHSPDSVRNLNALITGEPVDYGLVPKAKPPGR